MRTPKPACSHVRDGSRKHHARGMCAGCYRMWRIHNNPEIAEKARAASQKSAREWRIKYPDKALASDLRRYGLTVVEYKRLLRKQRGRCAICGRLPGKRRLNVDHNHKTGKVRGLLCWVCNYHIVGFIERCKVPPQRITQYLNEDK